MDEVDDLEPNAVVADAPGDLGAAPDRWRPIAPVTWATVTWRGARPRAHEFADGVAVIAALAVIGLGVAWVWEQLSPRLAYRVTKPGLAYELSVESEKLFAADGWFAVCGTVVGVVTALVGFRVFARSRGPLMLLAIAVGSLAGSVVAWRFGDFLGRFPTHGQANAILHHVGAILDQRLSIRAKVVLLFQPIGAVVVYAICISFARHPDLSRGRQPPRHSAAHAPDAPA